MNIRFSLAKKIILLFVIIATFVLGGTLFYITMMQKKYMTDSAKEKANFVLEKHKSKINNVITQDFSKVEGVLHSILDFEELKNYEVRKNFITNAVKNALINNPNYIAFWVLFEAQKTDTNFRDKNFRQDYTFYTNQYGKIEYREELKNIDEMNEDSDYIKIRKEKENILLEPYWYSYTDNDKDRILETSVCVPLVKNNVFLGLVGCDIKLDFFKNWFDEVNKKEGTHMFLFSNEGMIISIPNPALVGKNISEIFPLLNQTYALKKHIKNGKEINFLDFEPISQKYGYFSLKPIRVGNDKNPWSIGIFMPKEKIEESILKLFLVPLILLLLSIPLITVLIGFTVRKQVSEPLKKIAFSLKKIANGNVNTPKLNFHSKNEIKDMADSVNTVIDSLNKTSKLADNIGQGILDAEYEKLGENDQLGTTLLNMRAGLIDSKKNEEERKAEERKRNWMIEGDALFGEILRKYNNSIEELSFHILSNLLDYVGALQGNFYVKEESEKNEVYFKQTCSIAFDNEQKQKTNLQIGEGLVGQCAFEQLTIYMEDIPDDYPKINSGLGKTKPASLLIVPIILNDIIFGVIEMVSLRKMKKTEIAFTESITEGIAATIANVKNTETTQNLLAQFQQQKEELATQEEEIRQNLEELKATQEEVERLKKEENTKKEEINNSTEILKKIIDKIPYKIVVKDKNDKIIIVNQAVANIFNISSKEFMQMSQSKAISNLETTNIISNEDALIVENNKAETTITKDQEITLLTKKIPIKIEYLNTKGILYIQNDISKFAEKEDKMNQLKAKIEKLMKK